MISSETPSPREMRNHRIQKFVSAAVGVVGQTVGGGDQTASVISASEMGQDVATKQGQEPVAAVSQKPAP